MALLMPVPVPAMHNEVFKMSLLQPIAMQGTETIIRSLGESTASTKQLKPLGPQADLKQAACLYPSDRSQTQNKITLLEKKRPTIHALYPMCIIRYHTRSI
jgi:hypothetical protein